MNVEQEMAQIAAHIEMYGHEKGDYFGDAVHDFPPVCVIGGFYILREDYDHEDDHVDEDDVFDWYIGLLEDGDATAVALVEYAGTFKPDLGIYGYRNKHNHAYHDDDRTCALTFSDCVIMRRSAHSHVTTWSDETRTPDLVRTLKQTTT